MALSSHSIPSFTLTSSSLLSEVLDEHSPTAIIAHADFLPQLLELLYDANEETNHTIIVVGQPDAKLARQIRQVRVLQWDDIERQGAQSEPVEVPTPGWYQEHSSRYTVLILFLRTLPSVHGVVLSGSLWKASRCSVDPPKYHRRSSSDSRAIPNLRNAVFLGHHSLVSSTIDCLWSRRCLYCSLRRRQFRHCR